MHFHLPLSTSFLPALPTQDSSFNIWLVGTGLGWISFWTGWTPPHYPYMIPFGCWVSLQLRAPSTYLGFVPGVVIDLIGPHHHLPHHIPGWDPHTHTDCLCCHAPIHLPPPHCRWFGIVPLPPLLFWNLQAPPPSTTTCCLWNMQVWLLCCLPVHSYLPPPPPPTTPIPSLPTCTPTQAIPHLPHRPFTCGLYAYYFHGDPHLPHHLDSPPPPAPHRAVGR